MSKTITPQTLQKIQGQANYRRLHFENSKPTLAEEICRVALNTKDPITTLKMNTALVHSKDPIKQAIGSICRELLERKK